MDNQSRQGNSNANDVNDTGAWVFVWIVALILFLVVPICSTSYRRKLCWQRLKQRRWDVTVEGETDGSGRPRPPQTNQTHPVDNTQNQTKLSKQEEEEIRHLYLLKLLSSYSMCLNRTDIKNRSKNQGVDSLTVCQQDDVHTEMPTVSDIENADQSQTQQKLDNDGQRLVESNSALSAPISGIFDMESVVMVPLSGVDCQTFSTTDGQTREVPNGCSICFSEYAADDRVIWSSNPACPHVFHEDCALHWFMAVGKKDLRRRRRADDFDYSVDPVQYISDFPILCPCCRQTFVSADKEDVNKGNLDCLPRCRTSSTADSHPSTSEEEGHFVGDDNV